MNKYWLNGLQPWATIPLNGTHSRDPLHLTCGFLFCGHFSNSFRTTSAMSSAEISISWWKVVVEKSRRWQRKFSLSNVISSLVSNVRLQHSYGSRTGEHSCPIHSMNPLSKSHFAFTKLHQFESDNVWQSSSIQSSTGWSTPSLFDAPECLQFKYWRSTQPKFELTFKVNSFDPLRTSRSWQH